jgi:hypothetical protein
MQQAFQDLNDSPPSILISDVACPFHFSRAENTCVVATLISSGFLSRGAVSAHRDADVIVRGLSDKGENANC